MGTAFYLVGYNWLFVLLISISAGLSSSILFMILWHMLFQRMNFRDSLKSSLKMSVISMMIMILTENIIILFIAPKLFSHQMHMHSTHSFSTMAIAMLFGFLFSLPYNYYHIQKTGAICH
jgi:membrane protein YdbS with pleckstrin-like domain